MNIFSQLHQDVLFKLFLPVSSASINETLSFYKDYFLPFSLTSKEYYEKLNILFESKSFQAVLNPYFTKTVAPDIAPIWKTKFIYIYKNAMNWQKNEIQIKKNQFDSCYWQHAVLNPKSQQWEMVGVSSPRNQIYKIFENEKTKYYNLNKPLAPPSMYCYPYISCSENVIAVTEGDVSIVLYDTDKNKQYSIPIKESPRQMEIKDSLLLVRTQSRDKKNQNLYIYNLESLDESIEKQCPKVCEIPPQTTCFYFYHSYVLFFAYYENSYKMRFMDCSNLKNEAVSDTSQSLYLDMGSNIGQILVLDEGIFTASIENETLTIRKIEIIGFEFVCKKESFLLDVEYHNKVILGLQYHMDKLFIIWFNQKALVLILFSDGSFKKYILENATPITQTGFYYPQIVATLLKVHCFFLSSDPVDEGHLKLVTRDFSFEATGERQ